MDTPTAILRLTESSGDLVGIAWKNPELEIIGEPRLGENFRLLLPKPGYKAAYFNCRNQKISRIEPTPDGVTCYYDSLKNKQGELPVWHTPALPSEASAGLVAERNGMAIDHSV